MLLGLVLWFGAMASAATPSEAYMYAGDIDAALRAANDEARAAPKQVDVQERYIDVLLSIGLVGRATTWTQERVSVEPQSADAHYLFGRAVPSAAAARGAYERALRIDPLHARSHMGMGAIHTAGQDFPSARAAYQRAVDLDASLSEAWLGLARTHLAEGNQAPALTVARKAQLAVPNDPESYLTIAVLSPDEAADVLAKGVQFAGFDPRIHAALSEVLLSGGDARGALLAAKKALSIDPTQSVALRLRMFAADRVAGFLSGDGYTALLAARAQSNQAELDRLVTAHPGSTVVWLTRSQDRVNRKDVAGALADVQKAYGLSPNEPEVLGQLGVLLAQQGQHREASKHLETAWKARPWDPSLGLAAATSATRAGEHEKAVSITKTLADRRRFDNDVAIAYADALLASGDKEGAYRVIMAAAERKTDERMLVAMVAVATQVGRFAEAADILEEIGRATKDDAALQLAAKLRAKAAE